MFRYLVFENRKMWGGCLGTPSCVQNEAIHYFLLRIVIHPSFKLTTTAFSWKMLVLSSKAGNSADTEMKIQQSVGQRTVLHKVQKFL